MATVYYKGFDVILIDANGQRQLLPSVTLNRYNVTTSSSLSTATSDANGIIAAGSVTATAGDIIRFSHGTYPGILHFVLTATADEAYTLPDNSPSCYIADDLSGATEPAQAVAVYFTDPAQPTLRPIYLGNAKRGATTRIPYTSPLAVTARIKAIAEDEKNRMDTPDFLKAEFDDVSIPAVGGGIPTGYLDTDGTLAANSDTKIATQKATKTYVDSAVVGLLDDRGSYNASGNVFPSSGGSGSGGAVKKGDIWYISVAGTLGGTAASVGSSVRALTDTPGQTAANWDILDVGLGYVPENVANKDTDGTLSANSDTKYASQKATKTYADTKVAANAGITGATKTKITYDSKGLVTAGADATPSDISGFNAAALAAAPAETAATIEDIIDALAAETIPADSAEFILHTGGVLKVITHANLATAIGRIPYVLEYDGTAQSVDTGTFYPFDTPLGDCFYECWQKLGTGASSAKYDWSDGYGGFHAMLRNAYNGNVLKGAVITNATNASPIVVTTEDPHGFTSGEVAGYITGVLGNTATNGTNLTMTVLSPTTFSINSSTGNGAYTSGGMIYAYIVSWSADDTPYIGQWAHSATGVSDSMVVQYYDGVPVGAVPFVGSRICGGNAVGLAMGNGYMGGSDHNNFIGRLAHYRIFESVNPHNGSGDAVSKNLAAFVVSTVFGGDEDNNAGGKSRCQLLYSFERPQQIIVDRSAGFPEGRNHAGRIRGTGALVTSNRSSYPGPQFVPDQDVPNSLSTSAPVQPAGKSYTPGSVPSGARIFDSFQRKNCTYAFEGVGGLQNTEGGSLGALTWSQADRSGLTGIKPFGILNEKVVFLDYGGEYVAQVNGGQSDLDIQVSRCPSSSFGMGYSTGICFRYVDESNYWFAATNGSTLTNQKLYVGKIVSGVRTAITAAGGDSCPANSWEVFRLLTKSDGTYSVACGTRSGASFSGTTVRSGTDSSLQTATRCGLAMFGDPASDQAGKLGAGLRMRWRDFCVFAN